MNDSKCPQCGFININQKMEIDNLKLVIKILGEQLSKKVNNEEREVFIGSKNRSTFHKPDCSWMENVGDDNIVIFNSHEEAAQSGYKPCKTCKA